MGGFQVLRDVQPAATAELRESRQVVRMRKLDMA
jgi:hypothetical protein